MSQCTICGALPADEEASQNVLHAGWGLLSFHCHQWEPPEFRHMACPTCATALGIMMMFPGLLVSMLDAVNGMGDYPYTNPNPKGRCMCCDNHGGDIVQTLQAVADASMGEMDQSKEQIELKLEICFGCMLKSIVYMRLGYTVTPPEKSEGGKHE